MGDLHIHVPNSESFMPIILCDTLYAPSMALTVVSISCIAKSGMKVAFEESTCKITNQKGVVVGNVMTTLSKVLDFVYFLPFLFSLYHYPEPSGTFYDDPLIPAMTHTLDRSSMT